MDKLWMKALVLTSVGLLLYFGRVVQLLQKTDCQPDPAFLTPLVIPPPLVRKDVTAAGLLENQPQDRQVFRQVFFEVMSLRGVQRGRRGEWLALFHDDKGQLVRLAPGDVHDGVTIVSTAADGCTARYGSVERVFTLTTTPGAPGAGDGRKLR